MDSEQFQIVQVASGAQSLRSLRYHETFHPVVGPMIEAKALHVDQHRFSERLRESETKPFIIWDVGLGAAANAIAILQSFRDSAPSTRLVELHSFDYSLAALDFALQHQQELGYFEGWTDLVTQLLEKGTASFQNVTWRLQSGDFRERVLDLSIPEPQSVIFDPYSPVSNPELWIIKTFADLRNRITEDPCLLTNYSRSTSVRTTLLYAGWFVGIGSATGEKQETTIASSHLSPLKNPLNIQWLDRVARSGAAAPLTFPPDSQKSGAEVAQELRGHPQFVL